MTINKAQGQSFDKVGIILPQPVFAHGQLYVALSRATSASGVSLLITGGAHEKSTTNIVFKPILTE